MSGTIPAPPATSSTGAVLSGRQTNQPPIGPRISTWSPGSMTRVRYGETSPSGTSSTVSSTRSPSAGAAME
jgi:hypothetical protein